MEKEPREILREKVVRAFNEYKDYVELSNKENLVKKDAVEKMKTLYKEDKQDPEVKDFSFEIFLIDGFHKQDIKNLGIKFVHYTTLYKELTDIEPLNEEVESSYNYLLKNAMEKQAFIVEGAKFKEVEKGFIESKKQYFEEQNLYEKVQVELEKIL